MSYTKTNWINGQAPAISADNLNKIENGIKDLETNLDDKLDKSSVKTSYTTSDTDVYSANYVNEALDKKQDKYELINVNSGTGNITLSKSAANYTMIEIFGSKAGCFGSVKLYSPNGKTFGLAIHNAYSGNAIQQLFANYTISGTTITKNREVYMNDNNAPAQSNDIVIDYVVGYK